MSWENSKALTSLKKDFLLRFFDHTDRFFLTGGSALGIFYLHHRRSFDLDFFTTEKNMDWHVLDNEVCAVTEEIAGACSLVRSSPTFRRYELKRGTEREILDFVLEFTSQIDREKTRFGALRVDTLREIMVNKICTLIGRCEIKDVVDLFFLEKHGLLVADHFESARLKEGGLEPAMISYLLANLEIETIPDYVLKDVTVPELRSFVRSLRTMFTEMAYPENNNKV